MERKFDITDLKIVEALAIYGPRNITEVARRLHLPTETLRKRVKRLYSQSFLRFHVSVNHAYLGLKKAIVFVEATPGYEDILYDALQINDFWIFVSRCYGMFEGCVGIFLIPIESCHLFEQFINELERIGLAKRTHIFWSTYFHTNQIKRKWFNEEEKTWNFNWQGWIEEMEKIENFSYSLIEPKVSTVKVDEVDILILKELEKDAKISFKKLGEKLHISPQLARYHFYNHILRRGLLKSFELTFLHFGKDSEFSFFIFSFDEWEKLARFTSSLIDKPFVRALGKILGKNQLYGNLYFPRSEFRRFLQVLSTLVKSGFLKSYLYVIQDYANSLRATIPFQCFKHGKWMYNRETYIKILHKSLKGKPLIEEKLALGIRSKS